MSQGKTLPACVLSLVKAVCNQRKNLTQYVSYDFSVLPLSLFAFYIYILASASILCVCKVRISHTGKIIKVLLK